MAHLRPCPACTRHVRDSEAACPFCDAELPVEARRTATSTGRLGRAALFVAGAALAASAVSTTGCGDRPKPRDPNLQKPYGAPPAPALI